MGARFHAATGAPAAKTTFDPGQGHRRSPMVGRFRFEKGTRLQPGTVNLWSLVRFVHVIGATVWVGGQLALTFVVTPAARADLADDARSTLMTDVGRRFARITVIGVLPLMLATGLALAYHRGVEENLFSIPSYGTALAVKIVLVVVSVALAAMHGVAAAQGRTDRSRLYSYSGLTTTVVIVLIATSLAS